MWDSQHKPRSDNLNAPDISYEVYFEEKAYFAGALVASICYGVPKTSHYEPTTRAHSVCLIYSRVSHRAILQIHGRTT